MVRGTGRWTARIDAALDRWGARVERASDARVEQVAVVTWLGIVVAGAACCYALVACGTDAARTPAPGVYRTPGTPPPPVPTAQASRVQVVRLGASVELTTGCDGDVRYSVSCRADSTSCALSVVLDPGCSR